MDTGLVEAMVFFVLFIAILIALDYLTRNGRYPPLGKPISGDLVDGLP
ncbi:MAG: hypothetical protein O2782_03780 [bacterium]|nr:hypothetical protein [bacterium]